MAHGYGHYPQGSRPSGSNGSGPAGFLAFIVLIGFVGWLVGFWGLPGTDKDPKEARDAVAQAHENFGLSLKELVKKAGEIDDIDSVTIPDGVKANVPYSMAPCQIANPTHRKGCQLAKSYAATIYKGAELACLDKLWTGESGWNPWAYNPEVTDGGNAYGIPQALNRLHGYPYRFGDWKAQVDWGVNYLKKRPDYKGSPCRAWALWQSRSPHWY